MVAEVSGRRLGHIVLEPGSPSSKPLRPAEMTKRDVPGFAIGGLSGGESKAQFWRMVELSTSRLPKDKPRYLMGVGYAGHPQMDTSLPRGWDSGGAWPKGGGTREGPAPLPGHETPPPPLPHSYATDLVVCVALGCDMFDCVYPTRTAVRPRGRGLGVVGKKPPP